ncbi:hypothetical protein BGZ65_007406, partial [Modicella reniformis]
MENFKIAPAPSTLFQSDPARFAISKVTVHDAVTSPVMSLVVDSTTSGITIHHPIQSTVEYTQDPEDQRRQRSRLVPSKVGSKELPSLPPLLKVHAREGLRLSFEFTGDLLQDPVQPKPKKARSELGTTAGQTPSAIVATEPGGENLLPSNGHLQPDHDQSAGDNKLDNDDNDNNDDDDDKETEADSYIESSSVVSFDHIRNVMDTSSITTLSVNTITGSGADADACVTTPEEGEEEEEEETSSVSLYASTIYFAETRTEQSMHDLCTEIAFQQQLIENPGSISVVKAKSSPADDAAGIAKHIWEWNYHTEERAEQRPQNHKAVYVPPNSANGSGGRSSSLQRNPRHWRRSSTHDKSSNAGRLPAFWGKSPHSTSHNSLPSLQESMSEDQEKGMPEAVPPPAPNISIPLANGTEDGPLFRATVSECEQYIRNMKAVSKRILKTAHSALEARKAWVAAEETFVKELDGLRSAESLVEQYFRPLTDSLVEQSESLSQQMKELLIEPLSRFYGIDIKAAEFQRKAFDEESKEYYSFLSRYMGMKQDNTQKKQEADTKHDKKRRHFELKRSEYWNFLIEMKAGGTKVEEVCSYLSEYAEKHCQHVVEMGSYAEELQPGLTIIATANKQRQEQNRSRQTSSKGYLKGNANSVLTQSIITATSSDISLDSPKASYFPRDSLDISREESSPSPVYGSQISNSSSQSISGIRDLEHQDIDAGQALGRRKEGFLFATSRPNSHNAVLEKPSLNWHKYWCVLSEGQLHEYSHWKKGVAQPHNEPINLRIATVRSCRNQDRRFCFEVITPRFRRVYQATSAEDMNSWINVISNAIQGLLNGTSSCRNLNLEYNSSGYRTLAPPEGRGLMAGLGGIARTSMEQVLSVPLSIQDRVLPGQAVGRRRGGSAIEGLNDMSHIGVPYGSQANPSDEGQTDQDQLGLQLLKAMRDLHLDNIVCADCGAKNPDWCVINLGILVCIECSGLHRSLGTHISKVRSLTLDTTSYTKDLVEFIRSVGNNVSNGIWEANLVPPNDQSKDQAAKNIFRKPVVNDSREYKVSFIKRKYVEKAFVVRPLQADSTVDVASATEALFRAISTNDIPATLAAFVAGANINTVQKADHQNDT